MGFDDLVKAFVEHPAAAVAALLALALGFVSREYTKAQAAHLATAVQIAPIAQKLAEGVEALERLVERAERKKD